MEIFFEVLKKILKIIFAGDGGVNEPSKPNGVVEEKKEGEVKVEKEGQDKVNKVEMEEMVIKADLITEEDFKKVFPRASSYLIEHLNKEMRKAKIDTLYRVCHFLAQCGHESNMFTVFTENLNYSREALLKVFPRHFNTNNVDRYARNPEKIANRAYRNRMGNGEEKSGDGWRYRGRGIIQLTGKDNYINFSKAINKSLKDTIRYIETAEGRVKSAIWYWTENKLNAIADKNDVLLLTRRINGGTNGLKHRTELTHKLMDALKDKF